jgi:3-hydroxyisobutyrate dehydrogenase
MGKDVVPLGPTGSGSLMKLVNNFMAGVQAASFAEAVALIDAAGLNREKAISILTNGAPGSPLVNRIASTSGSGDFTPNFILRLMAKDLGYAAAEGASNGVPLRTASSALEVFRQAVERGYGEEDFSAVIKSFGKK